MLCEYGCGQEAKYIVRNTHRCCSHVIPKCPAIREKNRLASTGIAKSKETKEKISNSKTGVPSNRPKNLLSPYNVKRSFIEKYGEKCQKCSWNEKHPKTNRRLVQFHRLDESKGYIEGNITLLCPNCHSMTDNFMFYGRCHKTGC